MNRYDVVYILKQGIDSDEIRYSLRSLKNLEHGKVWFVGGQPEGLTPDGRIAMIQQGSNKWERVRSSLIRACECADITDDFWLFNDDFFVMKRITDDRPAFGGLLRDHILRIEQRHNGMTRYTKQLRDCESKLEEAGLPTFDYALHIPMLVNKAKMLEALKAFPDCPMFRSIYGNYAMIGGTRRDDVKVLRMSEGIPDDTDYLSTSDGSFMYGVAGAQIRDKFKRECEYENGSGQG